MNRTAPITDWSNRDDPEVKRGLALKCACGAKPGDDCTAVVIDGGPLPNRPIHHYRLDKAFTDDKEPT